MTGKLFRTGRIINYRTGRTIIIPMDHGVFFGPMTGITKPGEIVSKLVKGGADAIIVHTGFAKRVVKEIRGRLGLIIKLTNATTTTSDDTFELFLSTVEGALKLGADAVSVQVNCGSKKEDEMLKTLAMTAEACDHWGLPLIAMMYAFKDGKKSFDPKMLSHASRIGAELGADIIKTEYTGSAETFKEVIDGCPVPVVIAGGPKVPSTKHVLETVRGAIDSGGIGVAMGRNIWQHENPVKMLKALRKIIHKDCTVEEAVMELK